MAARDTGCDRLRPVRRPRPGDHAFVSYGDDEVRWEVVTAFVRLGPARGEKVLVLPSPGVPEDEALARIDFPSRNTVPARERGQLAVSSMREVIAPDREFTAARQLSRLRAQTDRARAEGHTDLRAFIDMGWVRALGADVAVMAARETGAQALFSGRPYTEICAYDRRGFDRTMLTAMERAHPCTLLERLGGLRSTRGPDGALCLIGEADAAHRTAVGRALELAPAQTAAAGRLTVDPTRLHFLSVGCAVSLLVLARDAAGHERMRPRAALVAAPAGRRDGVTAGPDGGGARVVSSGPAEVPAEESGHRLLERRFTARLLPQLRLLVEECAAREGLGEPRRGEFVLAVDEIAGNAVEHAGGSGRLVLRRVGEELECRISDAGPGFSEEVIPELLPGLDGAPKGRGLWLARLVADRFAVAGGAPGTGLPGAVVTVAVRLH